MTRTIEHTIPGTTTTIQLIESTNGEWSVWSSVDHMFPRCEAKKLRNEEAARQVGNAVWKRYTGSQESAVSRGRRMLHGW